RRGRHPGQARRPPARPPCFGERARPFAATTRGLHQGGAMSADVDTQGSIERVEKALDELRRGRMVILVDDAERENEGDLGLAGLNPAGVICEVMNDDGTMARMDDLEKFGAQHGLMILSVADVIHYRMQRERLVRRAVEARVPTEFGGEMRCIAYENDVDNLH